MKEEDFKIFEGEDIADLSIDIGNYQSQISIWRIVFVQKSLFPCDGFGFIVESSEATVIFDGLGRRIGASEDCLKDYIKAIGGPVLRRDQLDLYHVICQITQKEFEEIKKIQFELELRKVTTNNN